MVNSGFHRLIVDNRLQQEYDGGIKPTIELWDWGGHIDKLPILDGNMENWISKPLIVDIIG